MAKLDGDGWKAAFREMLEDVIAEQCLREALEEVDRIAPAAPPVAPLISPRPSVPPRFTVGAPFDGATITWVSMAEALCYLGDGRILSFEQMDAVGRLPAVHRGGP